MAFSIALIAFVGCSAFQALSRADRLAVGEAAIRYMAAKICNTPDYPCAVVFVRVGNDDPDPDLLHRLSDLKALPASRSEYFAEHPGDVWQRSREKQTGRRGEILEITAVRVETPENVHVSARYGITRSVIQLTKREGNWVVASESITATTVA